MSSRTKKTKKSKNKKRSKPVPSSSSGRRIKLKQPQPSSFSEAAKQVDDEEEKALKEAAAELEKQRLLQIQQENEEYHQNIINDYIAAFVDHEQLQNIQNEQDLEEMEENEPKKPKHALTNFLEVLLSSEPNKKGLHQILTDQFLDDPANFEALVTADEVNWSEEDYGKLNADDWELDDDAVKKLMNEWQRSILDPVMNIYLERRMPFAPEIPIPMEIFDDFGQNDDDDNDEDGHNENMEDDGHQRSDGDEQKAETVEQSVGKKEGKKKKKTKKKKKQKDEIKKEETKQSETQSEHEADDDDIGDAEESNEEPHIATDNSENSDDDEPNKDDDVDYGSMQSDDSSSDDDDSKSERQKEDESKSDDSGDDGDDNESGQEKDEEDINWEDLSYEQMIEMDKVYRYGKKIEVGDLPQYVLQNLPSRFMVVHEESDEQTHMLPNPWKRIFYHYNEDKIELPNNAAAKTVQSEFQHIDFSVIRWEEEKKQNDSDNEEKAEEAEEEKLGMGVTKETAKTVDLYLQEIPNNYDDILDASIEVHLDDIYTMKAKAMERERQKGKSQLGEMMATYVDKFQIDPKPNNLSSDTFRQPRFIADFSNMKKYNEYCLINTKYDKMVNEGSDDEDGDSSDEEMDDEIVKDVKMTDEIAWAPWYCYRVRIWAKFTAEDWNDIIQNDESDSDNDDDSDSQSDEDSEDESVASNSVNSMSGSHSDDDSDSDSDSSSDSSDGSQSDESDASDDSEERERRKAEKKKAKKAEKKRKKAEEKAAKLEEKRRKNEEKEAKKAKKVKKKKEKKKNGHSFSSKLSSDDPIGYKLLCDHFVVQNDHCFGRPTRFYWDDAIHEDSGGAMDHRFGDLLFNDIQSTGYTYPNKEHPLYVHPGMVIQNDLSAGIFCNGIAFCIGKDMPYDLISIDVRVPPVAQLYNMATNDAWESGWGLSSISPYKVWRDQGDYDKGAFTYGDRMNPDANDLDDAFPDNTGSRSEGFVELTSAMPFECNAFYFNNHYLRRFGTVDPSLDAMSVQSDGYTLAVLDIYDNEKYNHGKNNDEWIITVGFTHPRPHYEPAVILWKNNSIEIRLKSEYDYVNSDDKDKEGHMYKQELLQVFFTYRNRGGKKEKILSIPIRQKFNEDYIIHDGKMTVVGDEGVESHIFILTKSKKGVVCAYLNGQKVEEKKIAGNNSTNLLQHSKAEINQDLPFQLLIGHKRSGADGMGKVYDVFHGYIYDVGVFAYCPNEFEINLMYRSLKLDHDIHLRQHWNLQQIKYQKENANLNFKIS